MADLNYTPDAGKSRDPACVSPSRRVRYGAQVKDAQGRVVFSVGFYRGANAKQRALAEAKRRIENKLQTGSF